MRFTLRDVLMWSVVAMLWLSVCAGVVHEISRTPKTVEPPPVADDQP
jgi:hypothetical protein